MRQEPRKAALEKHLAGSGQTGYNDLVRSLFIAGIESLNVRG
jgi:hypothetical protein